MPYKDRKKQLEYQNAWLQKRRQAWIESQGSVCANCGQVDVNFEVDHIDPKSKIDHKVWSWSTERREAELAKCQLLCQECHWSKTGLENTSLIHGTHSKYSNGCRCIECKNAHAALAREYRANGKKW